MYEIGQVVLTGTWLYDGTVEQHVAIQKMPIIYGSHDHEDPPEVRDDREVENYFVWFDLAGGPGDFRAGGGWELTLDEAKARAERLVGQKIRWE
jgi:hypothetical protein